MTSSVHPVGRAVATYSRAQLARHWRVIAVVLLGASVLQPLVSSRLAALPPGELLSGLRVLNGGRELPAEAQDVFAGVFANIRFALPFAALKLVLGVTLWRAAGGLAARRPGGRRVLRVAARLGIVAFGGIAIFFLYSVVVLARALPIPLPMQAAMALSGVAMAALPIWWLRRNVHSLDALSP